MAFEINGVAYVDHHVKYKEIHGVDEVIIMTHREHARLHNRVS